MATLLQRSALSGACTGPRLRNNGRRAVRSARTCAMRQVAARPQRQSTVQCKALFSFFTPKPAAGPAVDPRGEELVEELIELTSGTDSGLKVAPAQKEQIAATIAELAKYSVKNPVKSPLLFGNWKVLYSSKPSAVGGPLRTAAGTTIFPGQKARQILEAPNKLLNVVEYKTLGFVPGSSTQFGEIQPTGPDTFVLNISRGELKAGLGGTVEKQFNIQRKIQIVFLNDTLRIARFIPSDLPDDEASKDGSEEVVFVFQRDDVEAEAEEEEEEEEGAGQAAPAPFFFGGSRKVEGAATQAERQVRRQMKQEEAKKGTAVVGKAAAPQVRLGSAKMAAPAPRTASVKVVVPPSVGTQKQATQRGQRGQPPAEEDPRERRRREAEEARLERQKAQEAEKAARAKAAEEAKAKAKAEAERQAKAKAAEEAKARAEAERQAKAKAAEETKARAEAERKAEREKQVAIKELLAQLAEQLKEAQADARDTAKAVRDVEKEAGPVLKQVFAAKAKVGEAEEDVAEIASALSSAADARKEAEAKAKEAAALVAAAEKALKQALAEAAPKVGTK